MLEEAIATQIPELETELLTARQTIGRLEESRDFFIESSAFWERQAAELAARLDEDTRLKMMDGLDLTKPIMASEIEGDCKFTINPSRPMKGIKNDSN